MQISRDLASTCRSYDKSQILRSGLAPESLHFSQASRQLCCCWWMVILDNEVKEAGTFLDCAAYCSRKLRNEEMGCVGLDALLEIS